MHADALKHVARRMRSVERPRSTFDDRGSGKVRVCSRQDLHTTAIKRTGRSSAELRAGADVGDALAALIPMIAANRRCLWTQHIDRVRARYPLAMPGADDPLRPYGIVRTVASLLPDDSIVTTDVGQHQMWVAQAYPFKRPRQWLTSGGWHHGLWTLAAIGAALEVCRTVACFSGRQLS